MTLYTKIKSYINDDSKFDEAFEKQTIMLQNDSDGNEDYIKKWEYAEKPKPTDDELNALESEATTLENNNTIRATRRNLYGDIGDQLDEIYHNIDDWKARIKTVKDSNPKESS